MLARVLGRTLYELDRTMTADEFALWAAEYRAHPESLLGHMQVSIDKEPEESPTPWEMGND